MIAANTQFNYTMHASQTLAIYTQHFSPHNERSITTENREPSENTLNVENQILENAVL